MFSSIIADLRLGRFPDRNNLRKRFDLALTKKMGVINLPYHFWVGDSKINPSAKHLLWVAILLADSEAFAQVEGILALEAQAATGGASGVASCPIVRILPTSPELEEFLALAPNHSFERILKSKITKVVSANSTSYRKT